jgi:hypothetical protein
MRRLDVGTVLSGAWDSYLKNIGALIVGGLIMGILSICFIIAPPLAVGLNVMCLKALRKQTPEINDVFSGFQKFGDAWIVAIVPAVVMVVLMLVLMTPMALLMGHGHAMQPAAMGQAASGGMIAMMFGYMLIIAVAILVVMPVLGLAFPAVADGLRGVEALQFAFQRGMANWGQLFLIALVTAGLTIVLGSIPFAGLLIGPFTAMLMCKAYLTLTEGETAKPTTMPQPYAPATPPAPAPEEEKPAAPPEDQPPAAPPGA